MATVVKVTASGRGIISDRIKGGGTEPKYLLWGNGSTPPVDGDIAIETPAAEAEVEGVSSLQTTTTADDTYRVVGTITSASSQTISEAVLRNAAGDLFLRGTFTGIPLAAGDSIQFTVEGQALAP